MDITDEHFYGVGINDFNGNVSIKKKYIKSYAKWKNMLQRCYCPKYKEKNKTYIGCTVCEEWLSFSNFKEWFDNNYREGYQLDKDILFKGNKIYSPETCCFVPKEINCLYTKSKATRGEYPIGVYYDKEKKKFAAQITINNKVKGIGRYSTKKEAFDAYRDLAISVAKIVHPDFMPKAMSTIGEALNWIVFNYHEKAIRNKFGDEKHQRELWMMERKVSELIDDGFIHNYEDLMNYLRKHFGITDDELCEKFPLDLLWDACKECGENI